MNTLRFFYPSERVSAPVDPYDIRAYYPYNSRKIHAYLRAHTRDTPLFEALFPWKECQPAGLKIANKLCLGAFLVSFSLFFSAFLLFSSFFYYFIIIYSSPFLGGFHWLPVMGTVKSRRVRFDESASTVHHLHCSRDKAQPRAIIWHPTIPLAPNSTVSRLEVLGNRA